jgi:branched-subunit amino acid aminotransferase/4-amino-4-deoxychorismate lyase
MPLNHATLYGTSEFTTMRLSEGKYFYHSEHLKRLKNNHDIKMALEKTRAHFFEGEWSVRPTLIQNATDLYNFGTTSYFILVKSLDEKIHQSEPVNLNLVERAQNSRKLLAHQKVGSYFIESHFPNSLFHDGIKILESNVANFFFRKKNVYYFPYDQNSIFWGIGAQSCLNYFVEQKLECYQGSFKLDEINSMDEAWLINSVRGLQKVSHIGARKLLTSDSVSEKIISQFKVNLQESHIS